MASLFSAISGSFTKPIVLGALLPATVFILLAYLWLIPMVPMEAQAFARFEGIDPQWKLPALGAVAAILAALLHVLNTSVIRLYEGYPWRKGPIGKCKTERHEARLQTLLDARNDGRALREAVEDGSPEATKLDAMLIEVANEITLSFPQPGLLLPTRLGNTIRSFESYPWIQYRIAGIPLWPQFAAKVSTAHAAEIDDAKTSLDLAINLSFLSGTLAASIVATGFWYPVPFASQSLALTWIAKIVFLSVVSYLTYLSSIGSANEWGATVRSAFDVHRWDVLKDLGFEGTPASLAEERELWITISMQISRGDPPTGLALRYKPQTYVLPVSDDLVITRGASAPDAVTGVRTITVSITNNSQADISEIELVEPVANGFQYIWDTMRLDGVSATLRGTNPYNITIGIVKSGKCAVVTYSIGAA